MELEELEPNNLTVTEAAKEANVSQQAIRNAIYEGKLPARQLLGRHLIARSDFDIYLKDRRPPGRPLHSKSQVGKQTR